VCVSAGLLLEVWASENEASQWEVRVRMHRVWCLKGNNKYGAESFWMLISEPMLRNLHTRTRERERVAVSVGRF
jgi:hypothetical protein